MGRSCGGLASQANSHTRIVTMEIGTWPKAYQQYGFQPTADLSEREVFLDKGFSGGLEPTPLGGIPPSAHLRGQEY